MIAVNLVDQNGKPVPLSGATTMEIILRDPSGKSLPKSAEFSGDGSDGQIEYTTVAGDIDVEGYWEIRGHVITPLGEWWSDIGLHKLLPAWQ